ncbi:hypothetical protein V8C86DRAFT_2874712 [Haematococcus lacustris]
MYTLLLVMQLGHRVMTGSCHCVITSDCRVTGIGIAHIQLYQIAILIWSGYISHTRSMLPASHHLGLSHYICIHLHYSRHCDTSQLPQWTPLCLAVRKGAQLQTVNR